MSKVGKTLNTVTSATTRASGVVTKNVGEVIGDVAKAVGVDEEICNKIEQTSDKMGKDLYYAGRKIGNKVENKAEDVIDATKEKIQAVKNRFDSMSD